MPRVLIVDDSSFSRKQLRRILDPTGFEILEADNGQTGLDAIDQHQPDCVVTDMLMPVIDGLGLLQALHDRGITLPVLVHTADIQSSTRKDCEALHCFGFVNKPCDPDKLLELVNQMIDLNQRDVA